MFASIESARKGRPMCKTIVHMIWTPVRCRSDIYIYICRACNTASTTTWFDAENRAVAAGTGYLLQTHYTWVRPRTCEDALK